MGNNDVPWQERGEAITMGLYWLFGTSKHLSIIN